MSNSSTIRIFLAPMQGHTDYLYRRVYEKTFGNIDKYYIPYLTYERDGSIRKSRIKDALPAHNIGLNAVPQIMAANEKEASDLLQMVQEYGYTHVNLNMGCPFPMVVNRGKGCALLQHPATIEKILSVLTQSPLKVSVKTRTGMVEQDEFLAIIPILNSFPLDEVIIHPRVGKQQYKGSADIESFHKFKGLLKHPVVYNGDITKQNFAELFANELKEEQQMMIGRGILSDPFLPLRIKNIPVEDEKPKMKLFIENLVQEYLIAFEQEQNVLSKMQEHFQYLGEWFPPELKIPKRVKKARTLSEFKEAMRVIF